MLAFATWDILRLPDIEYLNLMKISVDMCEVDPGFLDPWC